MKITPQIADEMAEKLFDQRNKMTEQEFINAVKEFLATKENARRVQQQFQQEENPVCDELFLENDAEKISINGNILN